MLDHDPSDIALIVDHLGGPQRQDIYGHRILAVLDGELEPLQEQGWTPHLLLLVRFTQLQNHTWLILDRDQEPTPKEFPTFEW